MRPRTREHAWPARVWENEDRDRWRRATLREKGDTLIDLLGLVDAIGRFPERSTRFPGFPRRATRPLDGEA
jgi:hypothetical protein